MSEINEKLLLHFLHNIDYLEADQNVIGATTDITLRTVTAHNDANCKYVKKFGTDYAIGDITNINLPVARSDGGGVNQWRYNFYGYDGTTWQLMARLTDANAVGTFTDVAAVVAERVRIELELLAGTITINDGDVINLFTDVDAVPHLNIYLSGEGNNMDGFFWYLSATGSTYYDENYIHGGWVSTGQGTIKLPYYNLVTAENNLGGAFTIVTVLDSETYEVPDWALDSIAAEKVQVVLGQTAKLTAGVGARITREVSPGFNNSTAIYFNENGDDADVGTWQAPKLTFLAARNARAGRANIIYGGNNASVNGIINEAINFGNNNVTLESEYGYTPTLKYTAGNVVTMGGAFTDSRIYGFNIEGSPIYSGILCGDLGVNARINDNTISNCLYGIAFNINTVINGQILRNNIHSCASGAIAGGPIVGNVSMTIEKNILNNNVGQGINLTTGAGVFTTIIENNLIFKNTGGIYLVTGVGTTINCTIGNNTITQNNTYGINLWEAGTINETVADNIVYNNTTYDLFATGFNPAITESNYGTNAPGPNNWIIGAGCITSNPRFCKITAPYEFGLSANSEAYKADTSIDDMGIHFRMIEINESDIEINGFLIDGQEQYNSGIYIVDAVNHIGTLLKWNSVYDFQGIAIDPYDDNTDTDIEIKNNKIYRNGNGIKLSYGGNTIEENLIYNNTIYGIHSNYTAQTFNHNVFYGNQYALYLGTTSSGIIYKNNISHLNSLYGIYSEVLLSINNCCITDGVNNVDITDDSNIADEPLFINTDEGDENFHIKTKFGGYVYDSPCIAGSDDDPVKDIGAYDVLRSVANESWKKYQLKSNPMNLDPYPMIKGVVGINNAVGNLKRYGLATKRVFPLQYSDDDLQTQEQLETLQYISLLIPGIDGLKEADCEILYHILPNQKLFEGTAGTIDGTAKTIDDALQEWNRNVFKGFWTAVKFTSGVDLVIDAILKTGTKAGAGWTIDEWIGYYFYHNYNYYYILSNTATVLTLSDPDGTLLDETASTYAIEKYFKILTNSKNQIFLKDEDDELPTGSYDYYIDFIKVQSVNKDFKPKQEGYFYQKYFAKTGFQAVFEEK